MGDSLSFLPEVSVSAGGWGQVEPLQVFRTGGLVNLPQVFNFCLGGGRFSWVLLLLKGRFLFPFLSPQGTPVAGSELAQLSAKCCHPK